MMKMGETIMIKRKKNFIAYVALTALTAGMLGNVNPMVVSADEEGKVTKIQILGTTDVHGKFKNFEYATVSNAAGGFNQISKVVKEKRAENPNTLVLDNGDSIQGNYNNLFTTDAFLNDNTNPVAMSLKEIGYDTMVLGNHEFNFGLNILNKVIGQIETGKTEVLCGNLYKGDERAYKAYSIREVDGVRVAIIGVTTNHIMKWDGDKLQGYRFTRPDVEVRKIIDEIKENNAADVFVVSAHVGSENEYGDGDSAKDIANLCPEVSVILAGHTHERLEKEVVNGVLITEPKNNGVDLADIDLEVEKTSEGVKVINKDASLITFAKNSETDADLEAKLEKYHNIALSDALSTIGTLEGSNLADDNEVKGIPQSFVSDQGVTDLVNAAQLYNSKKHLESINADLTNAHVVSGTAMLSPTANLMAGEITKAGLANIYRYDNKLYTVKTTGKQLKKYLEWSAQFFNTFNEGDLTVSFNKDFGSFKYDMLTGVTYDINISKEAGNRIENLYFSDGKVVEDTDLVYLAVNDFRYSSQLSPLFDKGEHELVYESTNDTLSDIRDMVADYIINVKGGTITKEVDNNWKLTGVIYNEELRAKVVELINNGTINVQIKDDVAIETMTYDKVIAQLRELGLEEKIQELENIKNGSVDNGTVETPDNGTIEQPSDNGHASVIENIVTNVVNKVTTTVNNVVSAIKNLFGKIFG
ncbi:MAG: hypothetical protein E7214_02785 [Clostridium sp.]|nr:hypothetical protein [Clostridium sp.]